MKFKRFFVLLIASSIIMHASFKSTEQICNERVLASAASTINSQTGRPCLCNPLEYADRIKSNPEVGKVRLSDGPYEMSPLLYAAKHCSAREVEAILNSHVANKLPVDDDVVVVFGGQRRTTYLHNNMLHLIAFRTDWTNPEDLAAFKRMVKTLTANGVDINRTNFYEKAPLSMEKFDPNYPSSLPEKQQERAKALIDCGAQTQWWFGADPLSQAEKATEVTRTLPSNETIILVPNHINTTQLTPSQVTVTVENYLSHKYPSTFRAKKIAAYARFLANYTPNTESTSATQQDAQPSALINQVMLDFKNAKTKEELEKLYERISKFNQAGYDSIEDITKEIIARYNVCQLIQEAVRIKQQEEQRVQSNAAADSAEVPWYTRFLEHFNKNMIQ